MNQVPSVEREPAAVELRRVKIVFAALYFFFMLARAVFGPFITLYLEEKGLSPEQIGLITGINSFIIIISQPVWGIVADRIRSMKKTLILCMICQAVFALSLLFANEIFLIAIAFMIYTSFSSSEGPLIPIFSGLLLAIALVLLFVKTGSAPAKAVTLKEMQIGRVFRDKKFLIFLCYVFFMQLAHRGSFTFYPLLIKQLGGDTSLVGYASALMFVSEAVIMFLSKRMLKKTKPEILVMISSFAFVLWHFFFSICQTPGQVVLACLMDGPSFALFTIGTLYYMDSIAPPDIRTTYQTVAYSIYFGLSGIVGNMASGWLIENLGYRPMYWIGMTVTLTSTIVFFFVRRVAGAKAAGATLEK